MVNMVMIFILFSFCTTYSDNIFYISEHNEKEITNISSGNHYIIDPSFYDHKKTEIRIFFPKKNFTSNPNPVTIVYEENSSGYIDKGIITTHHDSTKEYFIVYGSHSCNHYSYDWGCHDLKFEIIANKDIPICIVTLSSIDNTSDSGKILYFGLIISCILLSIITILKTKACGDCVKKSENIGQLQNDPIQSQPQPQINKQDDQPLIQP